eukprot:gene9350-7422_t
MVGRVPTGLPIVPCILDGAGVNCDMIVGMITCDGDLNSLSAAVPPGSFISGFCPASCEKCPGLCLDDPSGLLAGAGASCDILLPMLTCEGDLSTLSAA